MPARFGSFYRVPMFPYLPELETGAVVHVEREKWQGVDPFRIIFDDGSEDPFTLQTSVGASDRIPWAKDSGRVDLECSVWIEKDGPHCAMRRPATYEDLWLRCYTAEEIGAEVALSAKQVERELTDISSELKKCRKVTFSEDGFTPPIYNVWAFGKKTNNTAHFGNTEQRIVDNLLWLYTEPGDIVVDPFGGGGSTLDICTERGRRSLQAGGRDHGAG